MAGLLPWRSLYVGWLLLSAAATAGIGWWVYTRTDEAARRAFTVLMAVDTCWALTAAVEIWSWRPAVTWAGFYAGLVLSLTAPLVWVSFARLYTGRSLSPRRPINAGLFGAYVLLIGNTVASLFGPVPGLTFHEVPFQYVTGRVGPFHVLGHVYALGAIGIGVYYLAELFVKSRHRSSTSVLVLLAGVATSFVPYTLTTAGLTPVPAYNHTVFGALPFAVAAAYSVFAMGAFDIAPVARDRLVDEVDDAMIVVDGDGRFVDFNRAAEPFVSGDDPIGTELAAAVPSIAAEVELPAAGETTTADFSLARDGSRRHYSVRVSPITGDDAVAGYSIILRDVTAMEEYRRELERQNEQLDQFASTVSHDLRNPIQVASSHCDVLRMGLDGAADEDLVESVDSIDRSLTRMEQIVDDLQTLARKGQSVEGTEPVEFGPAVADAWETVDPTAATYEVERDGRIRADRSRLLSILENLVRNADEHAREQPRTEFADGCDGSGDAAPPPLTVTVGVTDDGFYVADDGRGVPADLRNRLFESGFTTAEDGTGFGLTIVETMAESHGWSVSIDPGYDEGARFVITDAVTEPA